MAESTRTTCPYCGVGCGVIVTPRQEGGFDVQGDPDHPANYGRLCSKGSALGETLGDDGRLLHPVVDGMQSSWDSALGRVADAFNTVIEEHGPDAVAFYVSGQLMTEAYYVANKLMKGFIGSGNIDTNSRLCMASSVAGHKRAFGSDTVPGNYEDIEIADLVVLIGSNLAWCHPVLYQRLAAAKKERGTKVVVIDPRRTATCDIADLHLAIKPGSDVTLFNGLLGHLKTVGKIDQKYINPHTVESEAAFSSARSNAPNISTVAEICDLPPMEIAAFYDWFSAFDKTVTVYSQGINQSVQGTDKVNAIINCHLATDRIGKPGSSPFSVTGQPNAMGGREVGGLANTLAAHMDFEPENIERVSHFWNAPNMARQPGLKAVDLFQAVHDGRIKALWIMATNPAVSMPNSNFVHQALENCPFVVVSDCVEETDTIAFASVLLPATTWGERNGTVTNSERRISRQRPFKAPPGEAREDWSIISEVASRMGYASAFAYASAAEIFSEHATLSAYENNGERDFDLCGLIDLDEASYDDLSPIQWPVYANETDGQKRLLNDGKFFTPSGKGRFVPVSQESKVTREADGLSLLLNTGRVRDQWHTMTRTGKAPRLTAHNEEPFLAIHPDDARQHKLKEGGIARISNDSGEALARVVLDKGQRPGEVFMPIHWSGANSSKGCVSAVASTVTDPVSGQPDMKKASVQVVPFGEKWHALVVSRESLELEGSLYWSRSCSDKHFRTYCAGDGIPDQFIEGIKDRFSEGEWLEYEDTSKGHRRLGSILDNRLIAALFMGPTNSFPGHQWMDALFAETEIKKDTRQQILAGRAPGEQIDSGRIICACMNIGIYDITRALENGEARDVEGLSQCLGAGSNCGSCKPELDGIVDEFFDDTYSLEKGKQQIVGAA